MKQKTTAYMSRLYWVVLLSLLFFTCLLSLSAAANTMSVSPSSSTLTAGESFTITVTLNATEPVKSYECCVVFHPSAFFVQSISEGSFFGNYSTFFNDGNIDNTNGMITEIYSLILGTGNVIGNGTVFSIQCQAKTLSSDLVSSVSLSQVGITDETGYLSVSVINASLLVEADESSNPPSNPPSGGGGGGCIPPAEPEPIVPSPPEIPVPPTGPTEFFTDLEKSFSVSTWDINDDPIRFRMNWGDGTMSSWSSYVESNMTVVFTHTWHTIGNYSLKVYAEDDTGLSSNYSEAFMVQVKANQTVTETPPKNITVVSEVVTQNDTVEFSVDDLGAIDPLEYSFEWDFGDGTTGIGLDPDHQYSTPGEYTVTVIISDRNGTKTVKTFTINVPESAAGSVNTLNADTREGFVSWWILLAGILGAIVAGIIIFFHFFTFVEVEE